MSLVDATIFIVLVIFSMLRMDLRRPSISRSVAKFAALATTGLEDYMSAGVLPSVSVLQVFKTWTTIMDNPSRQSAATKTYLVDAALPTLRAGRAAFESIVENRQEKGTG